jgi:hypothetical protein
VAVGEPPARSAQAGILRAKREVGFDDILKKPVLTHARPRDSTPKRNIIRERLDNAMAYNVPRVGNVALRPTGPKGHVAELRVAAPRSPRRLPRRRCAYALLCAVVHI